MNTTELTCRVLDLDPALPVDLQERTIADWEKTWITTWRNEYSTLNDEQFQLLWGKVWKEEHDAGRAHGKQRWNRYFHMLEEFDRSYTLYQGLFVGQ